MILGFYCAAEADACQDPPQLGCCFHVYAAGIEMGVASSTINYVAEGLWPDPTIRQLFAGGNEISISNTLCSCLGPAWSALNDRLATLDRHAERIAKGGESREAAYHFTQGTVKEWAEDLNRVSVQSTAKKIGTGLDLFGDVLGSRYHIGYAHHAFLVAVEKDHVGFVEKSTPGRRDSTASTVPLKPSTGCTRQRRTQTWAGYAYISGISACPSSDSCRKCS
jgi:hypothetical protein